MRSSRRYPATVTSQTLQQSRLFIEHRSVPRVMVRGGLASFMSLPGDDSEGDAVLLNLSLHGCQLDSEQHLPTDKPYQLIIVVPLHPSPILIQQAVTQWSQGRLFGIKFLDAAPASTLQIHEAVRRGPAPSWVLNTIRFGIWSGHSFC
jgi:hypothetical protein